MNGNKKISSFERGKDFLLGHIPSACSKYFSQKLDQ